MSLTYKEIRETGNKLNEDGKLSDRILQELFEKNGLSGKLEEKECYEQLRKSCKQSLDILLERSAEIIDVNIQNASRNFWKKV